MNEYKTTLIFDQIIQYSIVFYNIFKRPKNYFKKFIYTKKLYTGEIENVKNNALITYDISNLSDTTIVIIERQYQEKQS